MSTTQAATPPQVDERERPAPLPTPLPAPDTVPPHDPTQASAPTPPTGTEPSTAAVTVYVPAELRDKLVNERRRRAAADDPTTNASIVLGAIEDAADQLDHLVARDEMPAAGGLFTTRPAAPAAAVTVQLGIRITRGDRDTLGQLAHRHTDGDRSRLVTIALRARYQRNP